MQEKCADCKQDGIKIRLSDGTIDEKAELTLLVEDVIRLGYNPISMNETGIKCRAN